MLSLFLSFALSNVLGFDIAGDSVRAALITTGQNIAILNSKEEERRFPTIMTVVPNRKDEKGKVNMDDIPDIINKTDISNFTFLFNDWNAIRKYPNGTIRYPGCSIAKLPTKSFAILEEERRCWGTPSLFVNDRILIAGLFPEIAIHRAFLHINRTVMDLDGNNGKTERVAIAVPDFYPQQERDSIRYMAKSIKYKPFIVGQMKTLAIWYSYHNARLINTKKNIVIFFNFGATNLQISAVKYSKLKNQTVKAERLSYAFDDMIGGRNIDVLIADFIGKQFSHEITEKAEQRLIIEAEKIKKKLTVIKKVSGVIESLDGINDLFYTITYDNYTEMLQPIIKNITHCAKEVLGNINHDKIYRVMLVGGSSRIPLIQDHVKKIFNTKQIYTSMLKDEMVASAAAMFQASMGSEYQLPPVIYNEEPIYEVFLRTDKALIPFKGVLPFANANYWLQYKTNHYPTGSSAFMIWNIAGDNTTIRETKDGLWRFKNPVISSYSMWLDQLLVTAINIEQQEDDRIELQKLINQMEYLLLQTKEKLAEKSIYTTRKEKDMLKNAYAITNRWFLSQKVYKKDMLLYRMKMFEDAVGTVLFRDENAEYLPEAIRNMTEAFKTVSSTVSKMSNDRRRSPREDIRNILRMVEETKLWFNEKKRIQDRLGPLDNPVLLFSTIREKTQKILTFLDEMVQDTENRKSNRPAKNPNIVTY